MTLLMSFNLTVKQIHYIIAIQWVCYPYTSGRRWSYGDFCPLIKRNTGADGTLRNCCSDEMTDGDKRTSLCILLMNSDCILI